MAPIRSLEQKVVEESGGKRQNRAGREVHNTYSYRPLTHKQISISTCSVTKFE